VRSPQNQSDRNDILLFGKVNGAGFMTSATLIGSAAALASTVSFAPQAWKIIKSRKTDDISRRMYTLTVAGFALWIIYGVLLGQWPLIVTNTICLCFSAFILTMKILPRRKRNEVADILDPSVTTHESGAAPPRQ
jgi:MtN3 and saliva related transmembrane protein